MEEFPFCFKIKHDKDLSKHSETWSVWQNGSNEMRAIKMSAVSTSLIKLRTQAAQLEKVEGKLGYCKMTMEERQWIVVVAPFPFPILSDKDRCAPWASTGDMLVCKQRRQHVRYDQSHHHLFIHLLSSLWDYLQAYSTSHKTPNQLKGIALAKWLRSPEHASQARKLSVCSVFGVLSNTVVLVMLVVWMSVWTGRVSLSSRAFGL